MQSIALPILSLVVPDPGDAPQTSLSCMWSVFTKCKDNVENGRRLENLSWRMWFRESAKRSRSDSVLDDRITKDVKRTHARTMETDRSPPNQESLPDLLSSDQPIVQTCSGVYQTHQACEQLPTPVSLQTNTGRRGKFFIPAEDDSSESEEYDDAWEEDLEDNNSITTATTISTAHDTHSEIPEERFYYRKTSPTARLDHTAASALSRLFQKGSSDANIPRQQLPLVDRELPRNLKVCVDWERHQNMFPAGIRLATPISYRPVDVAETGLLGW